MAILTTIISVKLKVSRKLTIATPSAELVDAYLTEIAKAYNVNWSSPYATDSDGGTDGGAKVSNQSLVVSILLTVARCEFRNRQKTKKVAQSHSQERTLRIHQFL